MPPPKTTKYQVRSRATIGQFLDDRDMNVAELADAAGLSAKTVSLSINGQPMTWATVSRIAHALAVTPDSFADPIADAEAVAG